MFSKSKLTYCVFVRQCFQHLVWHASSFDATVRTSSHYRDDSKTIEKPYKCGCFVAVISCRWYGSLTVTETMVASSSDSESEATIIFYGCLFFIFSLATLSQTSVNRHPRNSPTRRGLVFNRTFAIAISSKCPLKRTGAAQNLYHFSCQVADNWRRSSITRKRIENIKH